MSTGAPTTGSISWKLIPGFARDLAQGQDDSRHVGAVGHRPRELEQVGDRDRRRLARRLQVGLALVDLRLRGVDLRLDLGRLGALRRDDEVVREEPDEEHTDDDAADLEPHVEPSELLLHDVAPAGRTAPWRVKVTMPFGH